MTITVALFGAAGKVGTRIANKLKDEPEYRMLYLEAGEAGQARLRERGLALTSQVEAVQLADIVILAVPDPLIGTVAHDVVPQLKPGAMVVCLDPAAPHGGELPARADISYFITHPCHPPVVSEENDPEIRKDFWGGIKARQNVVAALMQGPESDYAKGEQLVRKMFAPVMNVYRITVEQMAILEPAMAETVVLTCMFIIKEAMDEAIRRGVPAEAAEAFLMGHMNINIGILFGLVDARFSDSALLMVENAKRQLFRPDWKKVFEPDDVLRQIDAIVKGRAGGQKA